MADHRLVAMPNGGFQKVLSLSERFWSKVQKGGLEECWPWTASINDSGYGIIRDGGRMRTAQQVALELAGAPRPPAPRNHGLHSDKCTTRACCNPSHLRWGTNAENVADRERLGRNKIPVVRGERQGSAKLTDEKVKAIRQAVGRQRDIAKMFGVCQMTVSLVKRRKIWSHVL